MRTSSHLSFLLIMALTLASCTATTGPSVTPAGTLASAAAPSETPASPGAPSTAPAGSSPSVAVSAALLVDPTIEPVSASNPSAEARKVLIACQVLDIFGLGSVGGMGKIAHGRDAVRYVWLAGVEPEIQTDAPAWLITFRGDIPMPKIGEVWVDPTCFYANGEAGFFATGPVKNVSTGQLFTPLPAKSPPDRALPPLAP